MTGFIERPAWPNAIFKKVLLKIAFAAHLFIYAFCKQGWIYNPERKRWYYWKDKQAVLRSIKIKPLKPDGIGSFILTREKGYMDASYKRIFRWDVFCEEKIIYERSSKWIIRFRKIMLGIKGPEQQKGITIMLKGE